MREKPGERRGKRKSKYRKKGIRRDKLRGAISRIARVKMKKRRRKRTKGKAKRKDQGKLRVTAGKEK